MFLTGETKAEIYDNKVYLPREYHLRGKELLCKWLDDDTLILSDSEKSLDYATGRKNLYGRIRVDANSGISIPARLRGYKAVIKGNISTIEITFISIKNAAM